MQREYNQEKCQKAASPKRCNSHTQRTSWTRIPHNYLKLVRTDHAHTKSHGAFPNLSHHYPGSCQTWKEIHKPKPNQYSLLWLWNTGSIIILELLHSFSCPWRLSNHMKKKLTVWISSSVRTNHFQASLTEEQYQLKI